MNRVYVVKCKTPLVCGFEFRDVLDSYEKKSQLPDNTYLIHTEDTLSMVKAKFIAQENSCNVEINLVFEANNDFTVSIMD